MQNLRIIAMLGLILFGMFVAVTNGIAARERWIKASQTDDSVTRWERRVLPILNHVPSDVTVFGYVADWDIPDAEFNIVDQDQEYVLTQYALAPRVVQRGLDHEWIIGNFIVTGFPGWLDENIPSYDVIKIGFGIYLIHRTSP